MQLLGKDDHIQDDLISSEEKWSLYVDQFVQLSASDPSKHLRNSSSPGVKRSEPFLKRNLPVQVGDDPPLDVETSSGLELKICVNTYKIFFVDNTEDYFRRKKNTTAAADIAGIGKREALFRGWLDSHLGWQSGLAENDVVHCEQAFSNWTRN